MSLLDCPESVLFLLIVQTFLPEFLKHNPIKVFQFIYDCGASECVLRICVIFFGLNSWKKRQHLKKYTNLQSFFEQRFELGSFG